MRVLLIQIARIGCIHYLPKKKNARDLWLLRMPIDHSSFSFSFSWGHFNSQEKLKKMLMQNFGGDKQRALWYVLLFSGVVNFIKSFQFF